MVSGGFKQTTEGEITLSEDNGPMKLVFLAYRSRSAPLSTVDYLPYLSGLSSCNESLEDPSFANSPSVLSFVFFFFGGGVDSFPSM